MNFADAKVVHILEITCKRNRVYWILVIGDDLLEKLDKPISKLHHYQYVFTGFSIILILVYEIFPIESFTSFEDVASQLLEGIVK